MSVAFILLASADDGETMWDKAGDQIILTLSQSSGNDREF